MTTPLPHLHFINTRPNYQAYDDTEYSLGQGVQIWRIPLLQIVAYQNNIIKNQIDRLLAGHYQLLVMISPIAVNEFANRLNHAQIAQLQTWLTTGKLTIIAVGNATKNSLKNIGLAAHSPPSENNEGMMAMPLVKDLLKKHQTTPQAVLFCKGVGGRTKFINFLKNQSIMVDEMVLYERVCPSNLSTQMRDFFYQQQKTPNAFVAVLISSQQTFLHWHTTILQMEQMAWANDCTYICLGERLGGIVKEVFDKVQVVGDLKNKTLATTLFHIKFNINGANYDTPQATPAP